MDNNRSFLHFFFQSNPNNESSWLINYTYMLYVRVKFVKMSKLSIKTGGNFSFRSHYWKRVIFYLLESKLVSEKPFKHDRRFIIRQTFYFFVYQ